jgi:amino acid transporter
MTIVICSAVYIVVQVIAVGTLAELGSSEAPLADAAAGFLGPVTGVLIALGALVSIGGANAGTMLAGPRLTYALAEQGQLPRFFGLLHPRYRTPHASIGVYYAISLVLALTGSFVQMAVVSSVARLIFYTTTCCSVPLLRKRKDQPPTVFRLPGGLLFPILATAASLAIIAGADYQSLAAGGVVLAVGAVIYIVQRLMSGRAQRAP